MNPLTYAKIAAAVAVFLAGWLVNGWRWDAKWSQREAALSEAHAKVTGEYRERERVLQDGFAMLDEQFTVERKKNHEDLVRLRAAVDDGAVRLRVRATCPAPVVPQAATGAGLDHGAAPELDPAARSAYFALQEGLTTQHNQLTACQALLTKERAQ